MINIFVVSFACLLFSFVALTNCAKINSEKILSDDFINEINSRQNLWKAGRRFHISSELKNLVSLSFRKKYELDREKTELVSNIPVTFDSRKTWPQCKSISYINTQGNCASSYAVVPASIFTDRLCIQRNITRSSSADQLLTCCKKCGAGCFGGFIERSFEYMKRVGLVTGGWYNSRFGCRPYRINKCPRNGNLPQCPRLREKTPSCYYMKCYNRHYKNLTYDQDKLKITNVYALPSKVDLIKSEIINNGPVSATLTVFEDFFSYTSGVYYKTSGFEVGQHDVKVIGWGITKKVPYWLVTNSWGKTWGESGTFKIRLGVNECDIESHMLAGTFL